MIEIQQYAKYRARIRYHRTDDLQPEALPDGTELTVRAMWIADDDEKFAGEWIFEPVDRGLLLPERDLEIIEEVAESPIAFGDISDPWAISPDAVISENTIDPNARIVPFQEYFGSLTPQEREKEIEKMNKMEAETLDRHRQISKKFHEK